MSSAKILLCAAVLLGACQPRAAAPASETPADLAPSTVVARVDGQDVTAGELDARLKGQLSRAEAEYREKVHELRTQGLEELINQKLLEKKAKAEGLTADAYLEREVNAGIAEPTDEEVNGLYNQAREAGQELPPLENIRGDVVTFLKDNKKKEKLAALHEKLRGGATVLSMLPPLILPKVDVDANGPATGAPAGAPVTIVAFSDYECPFCQRADPAVKQVLEEYKGKVRLVYREFPLPNHPHAQKASEAALCAHDQNKYWEMHDKLFASQSALEVPSLKGYARELGLDGDKFDKCLDGDSKRADVKAGLKAGEEAGVNGTPAFFVNGRPLSGAVPFERFKELIDAELAAAK